MVIQLTSVHFPFAAVGDAVGTGPAQTPQLFLQYVSIYAGLTVHSPTLAQDGQFT